MLGLLCAGPGAAAATAPGPAAHAPAVHLGAPATATPPRLSPCACGGAGPYGAGPVFWGLFAAGAASAFVTHEMGHVLANLSHGNVPHWVGLRGLWGVPFFAISPDIRCTADGCVGAQGQRLRAGRRVAYQIATAGFLLQHLSSEVILGQRPYLRGQVAPLQKGWLAFNVALSVGYAAANLAGAEDPHGDAGGAAHYARLPRGVVAGLLLLPAALDTWRYFRPQDAWAPWLSRAGKVGLVGLTWRA